jgi:Mrp family chromosome partitioning ATPase
VVENLRAYNPDGAVVVTTPQGVAVADVRKELNFCKRAKLKVLGVIENMSGYACPCCGVCRVGIAYVPSEIPTHFVASELHKYKLGLRTKCVFLHTTSV